MAERRVLTNSLINSVGWALQVVLNLILIPVVIRHLGIDAFGVYAIVLTLVGYFSLAQGLNQATLKYLAEHIARDDRASVQAAVSSALFLSVLVGMVGMLAIFLAAGALAEDLFRIPAELAPVAKRAFQIVSVGFLPTTVGLTLAAIPQALRRYEATNLLMIVSGTANLAATLLLLWSGAGLVEIVWLNVAISVINVFALGIVARRLMVALSLWPRYSPSQVVRIAKFSGFTFGSSFAGTVVHHLDRLVIASVSGTAAVAIYAVAQLPMTRLTTLISKMCEVLIPEASRLTSTDQAPKLQRTYIKAAKYIMLVTITAFAPLVILAEPILRYWVSADVASQGATVMMLLGLGYLIRSQTSVPSVINLGIGKPEINAAFSTATLLTVAVLIYPAIKLYGLVGVAGLSILGSANGLLFVYLTNRRILPRGNRDYLTKVLPGPVLIGCVQSTMLVALRSRESAHAVVALALASVILSAGLSYVFGVLDPEDKNYLRGRTRSLARLPPRQ